MNIYAKIYALSKVTLYITSTRFVEGTTWSPNITTQIKRNLKSGSIIPYDICAVCYSLDGIIIADEKNK